MASPANVGSVMLHATAQACSMAHHGNYVTDTKANGCDRGRMAPCQGQATRPSFRLVMSRGEGCCVTLGSPFYSAWRARHLSWEMAGSRDSRRSRSRRSAAFRRSSSRSRCAFLLSSTPSTCCPAPPCMYAHPELPFSSVSFVHVSAVKPCLLHQSWPFSNCRQAVDAYQATTSSPRLTSNVRASLHHRWKRA